MYKSDSIAELAKALNKFQGMMGTVVFDADNPFFKSKYATLSAIVAKSKPFLVECGLCVSQLTEGDGGVTTILMHTSGEFILSTLTLKSVKDDPQGHGSAITYARRYSYASILGIVSDEDDDGNKSSFVGQSSVSISTQEKPLHIESKSVDTATPKGIEFNTDDDLISKEQIDALKMLASNNGYSLQDVKEFIFFEFQLDKVTSLSNKHLPKIKEYLSKKKKVTK